MNIGFICNELRPANVGGIGTFTVELIRGLNDSGHRVHVVSLDRQIPETSCEVVSPNLTIHRLRGGKGRLRGYLSRFNLFSVISKLAVQGQIDIVEVPDFEGWCAGWPHLPIPVVVRLHGSVSFFAAEMRSAIPRSVQYLERRAIQRADHIVSVSRYAADRSREVIGLRMSPTIVHNSVMLPDPARVKTDFRSRDMVCYTGTLVAKKGVFSLAQAWPLVKERRPNARLMMIGRDGRHEGRSAIDLIRELAGGHADSIEFTGYLPKAELENVLIAADVAVYPSYSEAFALAPMEAMALCVPTICTNRASGPELVRHNIDGLLCDPDKIQELGDMLATVLENESLRYRLGQAGRRRIREDFSYAESLQTNIRFYQSCIAQSNQSAQAATPN